jgi:Leucine-rich repeat (LRR) protein
MDNYNKRYIDKHVDYGLDFQKKHVNIKHMKCRIRQRKVEEQKKELILAKKGLVEVPKEEMDEELQVVDLSYNYISDVSIGGMPMLTRLDLSCNQVS